MKEQSLDISRKFSCYTGPITNIIPDEEPTTIQQVFSWIISEKIKPLTYRIRNEQDKTKRNELKRRLPYVTFAGTFTRRSDQAIIERSGLICIDIDHLKNVTEVKEKILSFFKPTLLFVSPSGDGLKVIYSVNTFEGSHLQYFQALQSFFSTEIKEEIDQSGKDVARACFICHDLDAYIAEEPSILDKSFIDTFHFHNLIMEDNRIGNLQPEEIYRRAKVWTDKTEIFINGNRNHYVTKLAGACHRFGLNEYQTLEFCKEYQQNDFPVNEIQATIKSLFANSAFSGTAKFDSIQGIQTKTHTIRSRDEQLVPPFPIDGMPDLISNLVEECHSIYGTPVDFWAAAFMAATAVSMGNSFLLKGKYTNSPALWFALVAPTGSGKSEPLDFAMKPLENLDKESYKAFKIEQAKYQNFITTQRTAALKRKNGRPEPLAIEPEKMQEAPECMQYIYKTTTPEAIVKYHNINKRGIAICKDELMGWINDFDKYHKGGEVENWLSIFMGTSTVVNLKSQDPLRIDRPCITIIGGMQPFTLSEFAKGGRDENGLMQRFAYTWPDIDEVPLYSTKVLNETYFDQYASYIMNLLSIKTSNDIKLSNGAERLYAEYFNKITGLINGESEKMMFLRGVYAKLKIIVLRLALIVYGMKLVCCNEKTNVIDLETMEYSIRLAEYFRATGKKVYRHLFEKIAPKISKSEVALFLRDECNYTSQSDIARTLKVSHQFINKLFNEKH